MTLDLAIYFVFRLSGLLSVLFFAATVVLTDWLEAAAAAFAIAWGMVFVLSLIALVMARDGTSTPTRA